MPYFCSHPHAHTCTRLSFPQPRLVEFQDLGSRLGDAAIVCLPSGLLVCLWSRKTPGFAQSGSFNAAFKLHQVFFSSLLPENLSATLILLQ